MSSGYIVGTCTSSWVHWRYMANDWTTCWEHQMLFVGIWQEHFGNIFDNILNVIWWVHLGDMLRLHFRFSLNVIGGYIWVTCRGYIPNVLQMWLVDTLGEKWSRACNLPKMFPLVSRSPRPQWGGRAVVYQSSAYHLVYQIRLGLRSDWWFCES